MAKVQTANHDIMIEQKAGSTRIEVKHASILRRGILAQFVLPATVFGGGIPLVLGLIVMFMTDFWSGLAIMLVGALILALGLWLSMKLSQKTASSIVEVSTKGLEMKGRLYPRSDIHAVFSGHDEFDFVHVDKSMRERQKEMLSENSGHVSILFGGDPIMIFPFLEAHQVRRAADAIVDVMDDYGFKIDYGPGT